MEKNFKLIKKDTIKYEGRTLYRIKCIKDIPYHNVKVGDLGGYVENEDNLNDNTWVFDNAKVFGKARVAGAAKISGDACIFNKVQVAGNAIVSGNSCISENAIVSGNAQVFDNARVFGDAQVYENARVFGDAWVFDNACVYGDARVYSNAKVCENLEISDTAEVIKGCVSMHIQWPITITHNHIKIGCKFLRIEDWQDYFDKTWETHGIKYYESIKAVIDLAKRLKEEEAI
jgi:carbonic anhydrase/acetyltransferase-like protein (isoleucine patch superfamily)